jgi:hypothetical protein
MFKAIAESIKISKGPIVFFMAASFLLMFFQSDLDGKTLVTEDDLMNASVESVLMSYARGILFVGALFAAIRLICSRAGKPVAFFSVAGAGFKAFACGMMGALSVLFVFSNFVSLDDIMRASESGVGITDMIFALICAIFMVMFLYGGTSVSLAQYLYNASLNKVYSGRRKEIKADPGYVNGFKVFLVMFLDVFKSPQTYLFIFSYAMFSYASIHAGYQHWRALESALTTLSLTSLMLMFMVESYRKLSQNPSGEIDDSMDVEQ